ncbi:CRISPR-associated endonuclease Cas2 [Myxococcota bacterium]|nr:CRISPR-associated endonuclease Cas2 [Myxococcota bacterium]
MSLAAPADQRATWLIAYDIVVDRRRARVARRLQREGDRIQKSVFIARLTPARFDALVDDLADLIDARIDLVDFIPLCAACRNRARRLGPGVLEAPRWMVF